MQLMGRIVAGCLWLALCYWVQGYVWGRRIVSGLAAAILLGCICALAADRLIFPRLEATNRVPRDSIKVQVQAFGLGCLAGAAISPLIARFGITYWALQVSIVLVYILLPWIPGLH